MKLKDIIGISKYCRIKIYDCNKITYYDEDIEAFSDVGIKSISVENNCLCVVTNLCLYDLSYYKYRKIIDNFNDRNK